MGGDGGCAVIIDGLLRALGDHDHIRTMYLVGDEDAIRPALGQAAAAIRQRAQLRQRQLVQPRRLVAAHAFAIPDFLAERLRCGIQVHTRNVVARRQKATRLARRRCTSPR